MKDIEQELSKYIHMSKYSRWLDNEDRRENWTETVHRYRDFWLDRMMAEGKMTAEISEIIGDFTEGIMGHSVMPSMRALMTAGKALERDTAAGFNCAFTAISHSRCFDEIFYLLMNGCGVGFSVERQYVNKLPEIDEEIYDTATVINVRDSKIGWATALKELISMLYNGQAPKWDLSKVRPAGARLKTFGGRASGPEPLDQLFQFVVRTFTKARGRKLQSIECHDLVCKIAETVIVGSVRRSACISMSNLTDDRMRRAKTGQWWTTESQRSLANNSVAYTEKPDLDAFSKEWRSQYKSKSGERGIINKVALKKKAEACGREHDGEYGLNPCGEAILRDNGSFCNLSESPIRPEDTKEEIEKKIRMAVRIGTFQSTLTDYRYLRKIWKTNAEEERLLGVSLTGIMDHPIMNGMFDLDNGHDNYPRLTRWLRYLKAAARDENKKMAKLLGIPEAGQITLVKPSGTVSQLCGTASGIHPRFSEYYIRRVRNDKKDPVSQLMIDQGVPYIEEGEKYVFSFYIKSPEGCITNSDVTAIQQLNLWKVYATEFCDGNPSQTIYYTDDDYFAVADWVWKNWDDIGGLSFFPKDDHVYQNAPFEAISKEVYEEGVKSFPETLDWSQLSVYELEDQTQQETELACSGGACER